MGFTQRHRSPGTLVVSYTTVSPYLPTRSTGGLLSVALARGLPRVGVTHHPALRSPDVPQPIGPRPSGDLSSQVSLPARARPGTESPPPVTNPTWTASARVRAAEYDGGVKILLPPSEGKTPPATGDPLDLTALSSPDLNPKRKQVLGALKKVSKRRDALTALGVGASLTEDVARNVTIDFQPCAPALLTYTGVLYEAMGAADLVAAAEADASMAERLRDVHVFSAVFGQVNGLDPIPAYRLAMKTDLGRLGRLSTWWKPILAKSFSVGSEEVVLDCRSSDYRAAWPGPNSQVVTLGAVKDTGAKRASSPTGRSSTGANSSADCSATNANFRRTSTPSSSGQASTTRSSSRPPPGHGRRGSRSSSATEPALQRRLSPHLGVRGRGAPAHPCAGGRPRTPRRRGPR